MFFVLLDMYREVYGFDFYYGYFKFVKEVSLKMKMMLWIVELWIKLFWVINVIIVLWNKIILKFV